LVLIGLADLILTKYDDAIEDKLDNMKSPIILIVSIFIVATLALNPMAKYIRYDMIYGETFNGYEQIKANTIAKYKVIPSGSIVYLGDEYLDFLRTDLKVVRFYGSHYTKKDLEEIFQRTALHADGNIYFEIGKIDDDFYRDRLDQNIIEYLDQFEPVNENFILIIYLFISIIKSNVIKHIY
jgi:hypothetical protein